MDTRDSNDVAPEVEVEIHLQAHTAIVTLSGEHDIHTQSRVSDALTVASEQPNVLVDLSECTFADSSVINALILANARIAERAGELEVVIPPHARATPPLAPSRADHARAFVARRHSSDQPQHEVKVPTR